MTGGAAFDEEVAERVAVATTPKQDEVLADVFSGDYRIIGMGGAIRGTKTFTVLIALLLLCRLYPRSRWAIVRKDLPTMRRTTIPSIEKMRPTSFMGPLNHSTWTYTCTNGSELIIFPESFTGDPELNRWRGLEVNGFALEEANEMVEASFHKAVERAGSWIIPPSDADVDMGRTPEQPPPLVFCTFNPDDGWVRRIFYDPYQLGTIKAPYYFRPLTPKDSPFVTDEQWAIWRQLPPAIYQRFIEGDWGAITDPMQLIAYQWIQDATEVPAIPGIAREAVDVARYGDDDTVFMFGMGNTVMEAEDHSGWSTTKTAQRAIIRFDARRIHGDDYRIDGVGLGAGVVDQVIDNGRPIRDFIASAKPIFRPMEKGRQPPTAPNLPMSAMLSTFRFKTLRDQAWFEAAEKLRTGKLRIQLPPEQFAKLAADLTAMRYRIKGRTIEMWSKDELKLRNGRSPDHGDAFVMWAIDLPPRPVQTHPSQSFVTLRA